VPKVLALMVALPLLTVYADSLGALGGMILAKEVLDMSLTWHRDVLTFLSDTSR
jgi:phospholipid/cholesterol/gamma-HCH transport system permease protein